MRFALLAVFLLVAPLGAQEIGLHGTSTFPRYPGQKLAHGAGVSVAGAFSVGSILADTSLHGRLRMRARLALSELRWPDAGYPRCGPVCTLALYAPADVRMRILDGTLSMIPFRSPRSRVEIDFGLASYSYRWHTGADDERESTWGFTAGVGGSWRLAPAPVWVTAAYTRRTVSPMPAPVDAGRIEPPPHSVRVGLMYRFADR